MDSAKLWLLFRANILYVVIVLVVWAVAHPAVRFNTTRVIDHTFPGDAGSWAVRGSHANVKLEDTFVSVNPIVAKRTLLSKTYPLEQADEGKQYIRIVAEYSGVDSAEQQIELVEKKERSILYVWFENSIQKRTRIHILSNIVDAQMRHELHAIVGIPAGSVEFNFGIFLRQPTVGIVVHDLAIDQLQQTTFYNICLVLFLMGVLLLMVRVGVWVWANNLFLHAMIIGLALGVVLLGVLGPGRFFRDIFDGVITAVPALSSFTIDANMPDLRNHGHFIGFFLLAPIVLGLARAIKYDLADVIVKLFIFAILAEVLQRHVLSRSFTLVDVLINISGLMLGAVCWYWYSQREHNKLA